MTDVALKEYLERRIEDLDRLYHQRFEALAMALTKAEAELREYKVGNLSTRMATQDELEELDAVVQGLQRARANFDGRLVVLAGATSIVVSAVAWALAWFVFA